MGRLRRWGKLARLEYRERNRLSHTAHLMTVFTDEGSTSSMFLFGDSGLRNYYR